MKYKCITGGPISENCYLLIDEKTNQAAVVDPGFLNDVLLNEIKKYAVQRILLTHAILTTFGRLTACTGCSVCRCAPMRRKRRLQRTISKTAHFS